MPEILWKGFSYFLLGLGLNLTPCVYPMLTITLSLFRGSGEGPRLRAFGRALLYVSGIVVMYTSLGVTAASTGQFFGALLQNFWVLLLIGLFIIALSFSMFGFYTFQLPSWLMPQQGPGRRSGWGLFFAGILVGVIAAPCMGPVVLALLAHSSQEQDVLSSTVSFLMLAVGLGTPYLVLGTFTGLLNKLPRSGAWLVWFERALGVGLLTFGCFYLMIAFHLPFKAWLIPLALLGGGIYLGWIERAGQESKKFSIFRKIFGSLCVLLGLGMLLGLFMLPPKAGVVWEKYRPGILEEARESGQPVILDFYADWCIPCHELDRYTYTDPEVIETLFSFRRIKVDTTSIDSPDIEALIRRFRVYGVPTIIFLDGSGREVGELEITGYISPEELVKAIRASRL